MKRYRTHPVALFVVIANLVWVMVVVNGAIFRKQALIDSGRLVYLELAPVDPRSLMQGDYMVLNYAINRGLSQSNDHGPAPTRGRMILRLDDRGVGTFQRFAEGDATDLPENEVPLKYRKARRGFRFGIESYFFEEGMADVYDGAKYAELRVSPDGVPVLVDLRGEDLKQLPMPDDE